MAASQSLLLLLPVLFTLASATVSRQPSIIRIPSGRDAPTGDNYLTCSSWRLSVETNNAGYWNTVPSNCKSYVDHYMTGNQFRYDSWVVGNNSLDFAKTVVPVADEDAWVFDVDDTLLSTYKGSHGFGSKRFDENLPALPASLDLYNELKKQGFTIFLLTGRREGQREATEKNLDSAGYSGWKRLILRGDSDDDKPAILYKSHKRSELLYEGYRIRGSSGDQWSDLLGYAVAEKSFKLPNPMYFVS